MGKKYTLLKATKIKIDIHSNAKYKNWGAWKHKKFNALVKEKDKNLLFETSGMCYINYENSKYIVSTVILAGRSEKESLQTLGHEETHAMQYLGQLHKLHKVAKERGLEYKFLDKDYVVKSDVLSNRVLSGIATKEDLDFFIRQDKVNQFPEFLRREIIAHIGGHIAYENKFPNDKKTLVMSRKGLKLYEEQWLQRVENKPLN